MELTYEVDPKTGCWNYKKLGTGGYGRAMIDRKSYIASRLFYIVHRGPITNDRFVLHKCDNPACVNPEHLFLGFQVDNIRDMIAKGRSPRGVPTLTAEVVRDARSRYANGESIKRIAVDHGVHENTMRSAVRRKTWKFVK